MLTNTLVVLLGQWCWSGEHIPVKQPPRATGPEGRGTRWSHSFPAVSHCFVQVQPVAAFQPAGQLRRLVDCFSLIASFWETYHRPFSSSKQKTQSLKIFPSCSSSVRVHRGVETQMREGQEQEVDSRCLCGSSFLSLIPDYFLLSGYSWFGGAEHGWLRGQHWGLAGGEGGTPRAGSRSCAWGCPLVTGVSARSCESWWGGLPWLSSKQGRSQACSQLCLFHRAQLGTENEWLFHHPHIGPLTGRRTPALAVWSPTIRPPRVPLPLPWTGGKWCSPAHGFLRGSKPQHGAEPGPSTSAGPCTQGWGQHPAHTAPGLQQLPGAGGGHLQGGYSALFPQQGCCLSPAPAALREASGESLPLQKTQWLIPPGGAGCLRPVAEAPEQASPGHRVTGETSQQWCEEAVWHRAVSGLRGWASETAYPSFWAPRERSRNRLKENK